MERKMKLFLSLAVAGGLFHAPLALADEAAFHLCQSTTENAVIRTANCDLALRLGGLNTDQQIVALFNRGQAALASSHANQALEDFEAILKLDPGDAETLFARAIAYRHLKQFEKSLADFDRLVEQNYQPAAKVYYQRSLVYYQLGDKQKTLSDLRLARRLDPNDRVISERLWNIERRYSQQGG